ncbi:MAG: DUF5134 domain-containing protein [Streptosporangiaceae bacterium]|jgi:cytochrome b561
MTGQSWLADTFAGIMIITAIYCASRLVISRRQHRPTDHQVDGVHVLMGVAMAGMLVPRLRIFWAGGWEVIFGAAAVWFAWRSFRELRSQSADGRQHSHHAQHAVHCVAMLYMFLAAATVAKAASDGSGMSGMAAGAAHFPTLALILAFVLLGYVVWTADRLPSLAPVAALTARAAAPVPVLAGGLSADGISAGAGASQRAPESGHQARSGLGVTAPISPRLAACCSIAMGVTMGYMLVTML